MEFGVVNDFPEPCRYVIEALKVVYRVEGETQRRGLSPEKRLQLHRKNSLYYRPLNGDHVGDMCTSLIHTCDLNGANPFDYLVALMRHADDVESSPSDWMP